MADHFRIRWPRGATRRRSPERAGHAPWMPWHGRPRLEAAPRLPDRVASPSFFSRLPQRSPKPPAIAAGASPSPSSRVLAKTRCPAYPKPRRDPLFLFHRVRELIVHRYGSIADLFPTTALSDLAGVALLAASAPRVLPFPPLARFRS